jgi:hypothetical protein
VGARLKRGLVTTSKKLVECRIDSVDFSTSIYLSGFPYSCEK